MAGPAGQRCTRRWWFIDDCSLQLFDLHMRQSQCAYVWPALAARFTDIQMNKNHSGSASTHQVLYYTAGGNPFLILIDPSSGRLLEAAFVLFLSAGTACRV
ncbi:uncharacterized protein [Triticum aestivum]|uniref:uncharacterized protein n=1 Tax=Triticum aestivum TaxID=4565 RepID=UPI001D00B09D|nr:uncharacterized protein LOC123153369 [Triticum aestivum]